MHVTTHTNRPGADSKRPGGAGPRDTRQNAPKPIKFDEIQVSQMATEGRNHRNFIRVLPIIDVFYPQNLFGAAARFLKPDLCVLQRIQTVPGPIASDLGVPDRATRDETDPKSSQTYDLLGIPIVCL